MLCAKVRSLALAAVAFLAVQTIATRAHAGITLTVDAPAEDAGVPVEGATLAVSVQVYSTYAVQSVSAQVGGVSANLTAPSGQQGVVWTGTLPIGTLGYGSQTLTIVAIDTLNGTGSVTVPFFHHNPPLIQVTAPIDESVVRSSVTLSATCTDDTGCLGFQAQVGGEKADAGLGATANQGTIDQAVDLTPYNGGEVTVTFYASNADGEYTNVVRQVYVETSPRLAEVATVAPGVILDFDESRVLYRKNDGTVVIRDRQTQTEMSIGTAGFGNATPPSGSLTSVGATWFSSDPPSATCTLGSFSAWYWNGGRPTQFGLQPDCSPAPDEIIAGDWALLPPKASSPLVAASATTLNLATGATTTHTLPGASGDFASMTVARNGDLFVLAGGNPNAIVYRDHQQTVTQLGMAGGVASTQVVTDGVNLVFGVVVPGNGYWLDRFSISAGADRLLTMEGALPAPATIYQANAGWIAYVQATNGVSQVWSLAPDGTTASQVSVFNNNSQVDALGPTGEVMFLNDGDVFAGVAAGRYLRASSAPPELVGSRLGTAVPGCDGWYVKLGGSLLRVSGTDDAGTGCPAVDGGLRSDAGVGADSASDAEVADASEEAFGYEDAAQEDAGQAADGGAVDDGSASGGDGSASGGDGSASGVDAGGPRDATTAESGAGSGGGGAASGGGGCAIGSAGSEAVPSWLASGLALVAGGLARRVRLRKNRASA
jgi:hypothetical protein